MPAYISAYLDPTGRETPAEPDRYRCRVCGCVWERRTPENEQEGERPSLIRQK
ncbi:MAG TPA: hypothetical protein VF791_16375 [Pyrinomonadaceae bacterium]